eukprot:6468433-Amphidinium_carterae.1
MMQSQVFVAYVTSEPMASSMVPRRSHTGQRPPQFWSAASRHRGTCLQRDDRKGPHMNTTILSLRGAVTA